MVRRVLVLVLPLALVAVACSESSTTPEAQPGESIPGVTEPSTATTDAPTTTAAPTTTSSTTTTTSTTTSTTSTTTSTTTPPTTEPLVVRELQLRQDGIGSASFGGDPEAVVEYVSSLLGAPTDDTGWTDPLAFAFCEGSEVRRVRWGVLGLLFGDVSPFASGRRHFFGWEYGEEAQVGQEPQGLRTAGGVTLGSSIVDLRAEFPEVFLNEGEEGVFPANYYVSDNFRGLVTGVTDADVVTVMFGGFGCGG